MEVKTIGSGNSRGIVNVNGDVTSYEKLNQQQTDAIMFSKYQIGVEHNGLEAKADLVDAKFNPQALC